jgi:hypothetical protein
MMSRGNALEIVAQKDDQKKAQGQHHLEHLGVKIHPIHTGRRGSPLIVDTADQAGRDRSRRHG